MTLNKRTDYGDHRLGQAGKASSLRRASLFVRELMDAISPLLASCEYYESDVKLGNAPAVALPTGKLAIAPDIRCQTKEGRVFWIEAKDKAQRFFRPDTGADLFQVWGWYKVWEVLRQPVLVVFKDPPLESCLPRDQVEEGLIKRFTSRWDLFAGKPYGGWLHQLLQPYMGYPQIFEERSRNLHMYILYFHIQQMQTFPDWQKMIDEVDLGQWGAVPSEIKAYFRGSLLSETRIRALIKEIFNQSRA